MDFFSFFNYWISKDSIQGIILFLEYIYGSLLWYIKRKRITMDVIELIKVKNFGKS